MENVRFLPWVGKDYENGGIFGKKIMALGESFYCSEELAKQNLATTVVNNYLNYRKGEDVETADRWCNTYLKFERALVNKYTTPEESEKIWNSIVFYNYLQVPMDDARTTGSWQDYQDAASPYVKVLNKYSPDYLIVWGLRLWYNMTEECWEENQDEKLEDGYILRKGILKIASGKIIKAIAIYHPSVGFSWDYWNETLSKFIDLNNNL